MIKPIYQHNKLKNNKFKQKKDHLKIQTFQKIKINHLQIAIKKIHYNLIMIIPVM